MNLAKIPPQSKWRLPNYVEMLKEIEKEASGEKLDIGCGRGEVTLALTKITGIDISKYAEWNAAPGKFRVYEGLVPPLVKKYGTFIFNNSFEHVSDKARLVDSLKKMSPRAKIILIVPTTKYLRERYSQIPGQLLKKLTKGRADGIHLYLVHEPRIYGWNFLSEYIYYSDWHSAIAKYFVIKKSKPLDGGRHEFFVCRFKK